MQRITNLMAHSARAQGPSRVSLRCLWFWLGMLLGLCFIAQPIRADTALALNAVWHRERPVLPHAPPLLVLDAAGQGYLAWLEQSETEEGRLAWASPPTVPPTIAAEGLPLKRPPGLAAGNPGYALAAGQHAAIAWAASRDETWVVFAKTLEGGIASEWFVPNTATLWTFTTTPEAQILGAWVTPDGVHVYDAREGREIVWSVDPALDVDHLWLALGGSHQGYVIWSARNTNENTRETWYAALSPSSQPAPLASGNAPITAVTDARGILHWVWLDEQGLYYSNNHTQEPILLIEGLASYSDVVLTAGSHGTIHLAWLQDGALGYAHSGDWYASRRWYEIPPAQAVALAVDAHELPHLAWIETTTPSIALACPQRPMPSLRVTWPIKDTVITGKTYVQAVTTGAPSEWRHIEFYLEEEPLFANALGPLEEIGIDTDGTNGWQALLDPTDLDPSQRYRIVAVGVTQEHQRIWTTGSWFHIHPAEALWLWPQPFLDEISGIVTFAMTPPLGAERLARLDLYAYSAHTCILMATDQPASPDYYTRLPVEGPLNRPLVRLDTRALPDGVYRLKVRGYTADGQEIRGYVAHDITVRNFLAPYLSEVSVAPEDGTGEIELIATGTEPLQTPSTVAFYLQQVEESYFGEQVPASMPPLWLGKGEKTSDGWRLHTTLSPHEMSYAWQVWALGCDDDALCQATASQKLWGWTFFDRQKLHLLTPTPGEEVRGTHTIRIAAEPNAQALKALSAWLQYPDGHLVPLGTFSPEQETWVLPWDTQTHPDGAYHLFFQITYADGTVRPWRSEPFMIANNAPLWQFTSPLKGETISGFVPITLAPLENAPAPAHIYLYYRNADGALAPLGLAQHQGETEGLLWNTFAVLDGSYTLVAQLETSDGQTFYLEQPVEVHNEQPRVSFSIALPEAPLRGQQRIAWETQQPWPSPLSLMLEYSPDAGGHWLPLAQNLPAEGTYVWDTTSVPDSDAAFLRLTVTNGRYYDQTTYGPLLIDNVNEPPTVRLLQPQSHQALGRAATIAWQATDVDGDDLAIALSYRVGEGPWEPLASGLPAVGTFKWDTTPLAALSECALRITAQDGQVQTSEVITGLVVTHNSPPEVTLIWPVKEVHLLSETTVLWSAHDPDGDPLKVDLYYSDDGGLRWFPLAEDLPNSGYYVWQVSFLPPGSAYRLRVVARDPYNHAYDESRGLITVGEKILPHVNLIFPEPGQTVSGIWPIRWTITEAINEKIAADILARTTTSSQWQTIAEGLHTNYYLWDTTTWPDGLYELAVRVHIGEQRALSNVVEYITVRNASPMPWEILLDQPKGGERWSGLQEIRWHVHGGQGPLMAQLTLSADGGETWQTLGQVDARQGRYLLDTTQWPSGERYLLRIIATDGKTTATITSPGVWSIVNTGGHPPSVIITSPTPWGILRANKIVSWIAEDIDGDSLLLDLWLSRDGGETWEPVQKRWPNTGTYTLTAPLETGYTYRVQLIVSDGVHNVRVRSARFSPIIVEQLVPQVSITAPSQGATLQGRIPIIWEARDPAGLALSIDIAYSRDGGHHWSAIAQDIPNSGRYLWETTSLPNGTYLLRLTADNGRFARSAFSQPFTIANPGRHAPLVSWIKTNTERALTIEHQALWSAWDPDGDEITLRIDYSLGPYGPWVPLGRDIPNTRYRAWETNAVPIANNLWLRLVATDGCFESVPVYQGPLSTCCPSASRIALISPQGGEVWTGQQPIHWNGTYNENGAFSVILQRSLDGGRSWRDIARDLPANGTYLWDTRQVPNGSWVLLRLVARIGPMQTISAIPAPILVRGNPQETSLPWQAP